MSMKTPLLAVGNSSSYTLLNEVEHCPQCNTKPINKAHLPFSTSKTYTGKLRNWASNPPAAGGRRRTLVLCFDGTGDQFDEDNSNVVRFFSALRKDDPKLQVVYYQTGIGTYTKSTFVTPVLRKVSKTLDEMFAWNLSSHVMDGYEFLMQNYEAGDRISIFGFSRGAYTARALAGMVQKCGLLPSSNAQQIPLAWSLYEGDTSPGRVNSKDFKDTFSIDVQIDFVGVWDTVASVGVTNVELPFVGNNTAIRVFRHALALDERRVKFLPNFYHKSDPDKKSAGASPATHRSRSLKTTDAKEVWFAGCHCDIGGGSVKNHVRYSLARIPLRWMIRQCFLSHTDIIFDADVLSTFGLNVKMLVAMEKRPPCIATSSTSPPRLRPCDSDPNKTSGFTAFIVTLGQVIAIPLKFVLSILLFPFKHVGLLFYYSPWGKSIRRMCSAREQEEHKCADESHHSRQETPVETIDEELEEYNDALSFKYDQLSLKWFWWILEFLPMRHREQRGDRKEQFVSINVGNGREMYGDAMDGGLLIHRSVKTRLEAKDSRGKPAYQPRAWFMSDVQTKKAVKGPASWNVEYPPQELWSWED